MKLKILHLENSASDAVLIDEELKNIHLDFEKKLVDTRQDFIDALETFDPDIILSDHSLNSFDSLEALEIVKEKKVNAPFILVAAPVSEEFAASVIKSGAFDFISKYTLKNLPNAILTALNKIKYETQHIKHRNEISENKVKSDKTLEEMADRLLLATRVCKLGIWDWDIINNKLIWNSTMYDHYGLTPGKEEVTFDTRAMNLHTEDRIRVHNEIQLALSGGKDYDTEFRVIWPDKSIHYIKEVGTVQKDISGVTVRMIATNQDITKRKKMEEELIETKLKHEKEKAEIILMAQEKERESIGYELHDNVNQVLASAKIYIDLFKANTREEKTIKSKSKEYLSIAMEEIRKLSKQLVVSHIDDMGLIGSIEGLVSDTSDLQLFTVGFTWSDERVESLVPLKKIALFRIIQEQMKNIITYSKAKNVLIDLRSSDTGVTLSIKDDGVGFNATKPRKGLGLSHIFERTHLHNGQAKLQTALNEGCTIVISIPFD